MFWSPYFFRGTGDNSVRWLSVNWPIFAWHSGNYIYMYANWSSATDENRSYEILWENELAVGTRWWAFIYFTQRTGSYNNITGGTLTWVTNVTWETWTVFQCSWWNWWWWGWLQYFNLSGNVWQISSWQEIIEIDSWNNLQCSSWLEVQFTGWHSRHGIERPGNVTINQAYKSLMVWVNTDNPQATLDVNGSLRIGSNCLPNNLTCDASNVGTMMYLERKASYQWSLVICIANGVTWNNDWYTVNYVWFDILRWLMGTNLNELWFETQYGDFSCILPKPNAWVYPMPATETESALEFEPEPLI